MSKDIYEKIMDLARRRGYLWSSFEIYGGIAGFVDYGPLGCLLKNNIISKFREQFIAKEGFYEIESPTVTPYEVLKASGHVDNFTDPIVECKNCLESFRADHLIEEFVDVDTEGKTLKELEELIRKHNIRCPKCGGDLILIRHKKGRFVGCSNYPECDVKYSLPDKGRIKIPNKVCEACKSPILKIGDREVCINPECPLKQVEVKEENRKCPKCGAKLVLKKGIYGAFYGCSNYPKCKYTEPINKKEVVGKCPKCGGDLVVREGKFGKFIGCSNYPKCKYTEKLKEN